MSNSTQKPFRSFALKTHSQSMGFSLIEMMLSMLIGTIILAGIFTVFANTRDAQKTLDQQLTMVSDARFAIELITYDLRHASIYGGTNLASLIQCRLEDDDCGSAPTPVANDCVANWAFDLDLPVYSPVSNAEVTAYAANAGCPIDSHVANTDVIVIRYADTNPIASADLLADTAYIRSNYLSGTVFVGDTQPSYSGDTNDDLTKNYRLVTRAYYISNYTDTVGDGIPSLRRIELGAGSGAPVFTDQVLMPGIQDLQIQFGIDSDNDGDINKFVNAENVTASSVIDANQSTRIDAKASWSTIGAVKIWTLVRAEKQEDNLDTGPTGGYTLGGFTIPEATLNDGYRRLLLSNVVTMRNMQFDAASTTLSP